MNKKAIELRNKLSKLHDEIAMLDVVNLRDEDVLDNVCENICKALSGMDAIVSAVDNNN